jgi:hyperosmotically inducible protein
VRLLEDSPVRGMQIDVDTRDGVVYLTGSLKSAAEKKQAIEIARTTEGVNKVEANLR